MNNRTQSKVPDVFFIGGAKEGRFPSEGLLVQSCIRGFFFECAMSALESMLNGLVPDVIVLDLQLPGINGWCLVRLLRSPEFKEFNSIPVLLVSDEFGHKEVLRIASSLGINVLFRSRHSDQEFIQKVLALTISDSGRLDRRILVVSERPMLDDTLLEHLKSRGFKVDQSSTSCFAVEDFSEINCDLILLDETLAASIQKRVQKHFPECIYLILATHPEPESIIEWLKNGADGFLKMPVQAEPLLELFQQIQREQACLCEPDPIHNELRQLRDIEERFNFVLEATGEGIWDWNVITDEVYYSSGYSAMLGYEPAEVMDRVTFWSDLIHPEDRQTALKTNMDCIENRCQVFRVEFRMKDRNGNWRWILGRGKAVARDQHGRATRMVGIQTDISERKKVEQALLESEARMKKAQSVAKFGHWEFDLSTGKVWGSEEGFRIYGIERKTEFLPLDLVENYIIDSEESHLLGRDQVYQALMDLLAQKNEYDIEFAIRPGNREEITLIHSVAELICDSKGKPKKVVGDLHLLISDVVMPGMNGKDFAQKLMTQFPNLKLLFMSGYTADIIAHHGVLDEGTFFLQKPFSRNELVSKVREVLDHKKLC